MVIEKIKKWWGSLATEPPQQQSTPKKAPEYPLPYEAVQKLKAQKEVNQQEAFDLLYYDKVSCDDFNKLMARVTEVEEQVEGIQTYIKSHPAPSECDCKRGLWSSTQSKEELRGAD